MSVKKFICTYFDYNFLPRGLALFYSIKRYHKEFDLFVLALDARTYDYLLDLEEKNLKLISHEEYDVYFKTSVNRFEDKKQYFFSATANLCVYLLENNPEIDILLYLDADVYLFSSLDLMYEEFGNSSIGLCTHRIYPLFKFFVNHYGNYNVGVNLFRNSASGKRCVRDWKVECDTWYPDKPGYPLKFFSDQIFLDSWVGKFDGIKIIENIGINVCYWNAANYTFSKVNDCYYVDKTPLMIFHFSSLHKENDHIWNTYSIYGLVSIRKVLLEIYTEYIKEIESFGLSNKKFEKMNNRESLKKTFFHFILKFFINEKVVLK